MTSSLTSFFDSSASTFKPLESIPVVAVSRKKPRESTSSIYIRDEEPKKKKKKKKTLPEVIDVDTPAASVEEVDETVKQPAAEVVTGDAKSKTSPSHEFEIFVGNVPLRTTTAQLKAFFTAASIKVVSLRFRSLPTAGCKVAQHGNQTLVTKVCAQTAVFVAERDNCNAYVVLSSALDLAAALKLNASTFNGKTLRIDASSSKTSATAHDATLSLFIGNVPFISTEQEIRNTLLKSLGLDKMSTAIANVRLIRDPVTKLGKGFGYVLFKDLETLGKVLALPALQIHQRMLRVSVCGKRFKSKVTAPPTATSASVLSGVKERLRQKPPGAVTHYTPLKEQSSRVMPSSHHRSESTSGQGRRQMDDKKGAPKGSSQRSEKKDTYKPKEKVKKPKHAARKAAQAQALLIQSATQD